MGTRVVLGGVGAVIGGIYGGASGAQWGWAIGSTVGGIIDPQVIKGPALGDIANQTSQEGVPIPNVHGLSPPIAGNIIACSEPIYGTNTTSGKGGTKVKTSTVSRTYSIGFCEGPVGGFVRVWRNNTKVYDLYDPEFNTGKTIPFGDIYVASRNEKFIYGPYHNGVPSGPQRVHFFLGTYDQDPSPDLEAIYGVGTTPAHRGLAHMVVVDEDLTDQRGVVPYYQVQVESYLSTEVELLAFSGGTAMMSSVDGGSTWTSFTATGIGTTGYSPAWSPDLKVLVSVRPGNDNVPVYSLDRGRTWSNCNGFSGIPAGQARMADVVWHPSLKQFCIFNGGGSTGWRLCWISTDGITFTPGYTFTSGDAGRVATVDAYGVTDTGYFWRSHNGIVGRVFNSNTGFSWSTTDTGNVTNPSSRAACAWSSRLGLQYAADNNGAAYRASSPFGTPWTSSGFSGSNKIVWAQSLNGGLGAFFSDSSTRRFSTDGVSWDAAGSGVGSNVTHACWSEDLGAGFTTGSNSGFGKIWRTTNGKDWSEVFNSGSITNVQRVVPCNYKVLGSSPSLVSVVQAICARAGLDSSKVDVGLLDADTLVTGLAYTNQYPASQTIQSLGLVYKFDATKYDGKIRFVPRGGNVVATITEADMVDTDDDNDDAGVSKRADAIGVPRVLHLNYYDQDTGGLSTSQQSSERAGDRRAVGEASIQTPIVMSADLAAQTVQIAHKVMAEDQKGELNISLPDSWIALIPTDPIIVQSNGRSERVRIEQCDILDGYQSYVCRRDRQSAYTSTVAGVAPPAPQTPPSLVTGPTVLAPLDIALLRDADDNAGIGYYLAVCGTTEAWAGCVVELSYDAGATYVDSQAVSLGAVIGILSSALPDHPADYPDSTSSFKVKLAHPGDELADSDLAGMLNGANLAAVGSAATGWELINYATVDENDPVTQEWTISSLLRGRRNSGSRAHVVNELFVVLDRSQVGFIGASQTDLGRTMTFRATTNGEPTSSGTAVSMTFAAKTQTEYPVGYLAAHRSGSDMVVSWQGAGRLGAGAAVAEGARFTGYRVIFDDGTTQITVDTAAEALTQNISTLTGPITVSVVQLNSLTGAGPATEVIA